MAGGLGERFWPLSTPDKPKQLLNLTHPDQSLLEEAITRIDGAVDQVWVVASRELLGPVASSGLLHKEFVLAEPARRNTLGCLIWLVANLIARHPNDWQQISCAILTADHRIGEPDLFRATVQQALSTAEETGGMVTIGIRPDRPETGYGYIHISGEGVSKAKSFREKPNLSTAESYLESGDYRWNSGMFFFTLGGFLAELAAHQPLAHQTLQLVAQALATGDVTQAEEAFNRLESQSVDIALMEKSNNVWVVPGNFPWDDVGSWDALERSFPQDDRGNTLRGKAILHQCSGNIVVNESSKLQVGVLGMENVVVVVTDDAVLVCAKDHVQDVKKIAAEAAAQAQS